MTPTNAAASAAARVVAGMPAPAWVSSGSLVHGGALIAPATFPVRGRTLPFAGELAGSTGAVARSADIRSGPLVRSLVV